MYQISFYPTLTLPLERGGNMINIVLPHPNPPLRKGREHDFMVSPIYKGGLRGVKNHNLLLFKHPLSKKLMITD
jgi:hypothetical protein